MSEKLQTVLASLKREWVSVPDLLKATGWKPHTLRAALSTSARKFGVKLERKRDGGVTSYRLVEQ